MTLAGWPISRDIALHAIGLAFPLCEIGKKIILIRSAFLFTKARDIFQPTGRWLSSGNVEAGG